MDAVEPAGHENVGNEDLRLALLRHFERAIAIVGNRDLMPVHAENGRERDADILFVIDQEYVRHSRAAEVLDAATVGEVKARS